MADIPKAGSAYPCGPCDLPMRCRCGQVVTEQNVESYFCNLDRVECETCDYCSTRRCPECGAHLCCGGCI